MRPLLALFIGLSLLGSSRSSIGASFAQILGASRSICATCPGGVETFIRMRLGSVDRTISIKRAYLKEVQEVHVINDSTGIVVGKANRDVSSVSILNLRAAVDSIDFLALWPSLSPSGRYLAYVRFFPVHQAGPKSTAVYMLLDLYDSREWKSPLFWGGPAPGRPFFPPENAERNSAAPLARDNSGPEFHVMMTDFHWINDTTAVFTDAASSKTIVTVSIGASGPSVSTKPGG